MSDIKAAFKPIPTVVAVITLLITTASLTYGITASSAISRLKEDEDKIQKLEISDAEKNSKLDSLQQSSDRIEARTMKIEDLLQRHILGEGGK
jgi:hypothetical protein